ncbi:hypothetical protein BDV93DRAFT_518107 [Ceratobasidium sp. AG-I]|nr:hypothetical protein BDV93DRAFT_518107 [Ceratobasidium sp. AG-I]
MLRQRPAASNVRFASEAGSRTDSTSQTTDRSGPSRASSTRTSSIAEGQTPPPKPAPVQVTSSPYYEIWEPPEAVFDHYKPLPPNLPASAGTRLGRIVAAAVRSEFTGRPMETPRTSLSRTRSVISGSDASTISQEELLRDARRLGLPVRTPQPARAPPPARAPARAPTRAPTLTTGPSAPTSRTLAAATAPSTVNPRGIPVPIPSATYKVWRASIARARTYRSGVSPYTKMIDDAAYGHKPVPPAGTVIESGGEGIIRAERALYASLSARPASERMFWTMPPDHDERVRTRIQRVDKMARELALYGIDRYLEDGVKGAIMTNAGYYAPEWPVSPAYDWISFDDARATGDKVLQESIALTDPATTTLVFIFLVSRSGESMAVWRRKFTVPASEQLRRNSDLRRVALNAERRGYLYQMDLNPPRMVTHTGAVPQPAPEYESESESEELVGEPAEELVVVTPARKKRRRFPWFRVDWGK